MSRKASIPVVNSETITLGERVGNDKHRSVVWRLHCKCGASFDVPAPRIKRGYFHCSACSPSADEYKAAAVLEAMPGSHTDIMKKTGFTRDSVKHHIASLRGDFNRRCYVGNWEPCKESSVPVPIFYKGDFPDVPQPPKQSTAKISRKYRRNIRRAIEKAREGKPYKLQYSRHVARALASDLAARTSVNPQHWFSALGL